MEIFSQYSDSFLFGLDSWSADSMETSNRNSHSDEEVMLASSYPKKQAGRTKFKETRHPVFRGVRRRNNNRWVCELREPNKKSRIWLGTYPTAEMAARAHDVAALALKGQMACLNFADSVWRLPRPVSKVAKDIQRAAAAAAEAFRPQESDGASCDSTTQESLITSDADSSDDTRQENLHTSDVDSSSDRKENVKTEPENAFYMDEEAMFDMPGLLVNMAEGLLLSPPPCMGDGYSWDDIESNADVSLWSYSI